jgi:hypothetical protein
VELRIADRRVSGVLAALLAVSAAGVADVGEFLWTRPGMFTTAPGRAGGSVLGLALWVALAGTTAGRLTGTDGRRSRWATVALAGVTALGSVGLTVIHLKAGIGGPRTIASGVLGVAALGLALASVRGTEPRITSTAKRELA